MSLSHHGNIFLYLAKSVPGPSLKSEVSVFNKNGFYLRKANVLVTLKKSLYIMEGE